MKITFGDRVRVCVTPDTEKLGVAGLVGEVYGETAPSVTGVEVIGQLLRDCALNVHFDERDETFWFAEELLEFIDHAPGTEIRLTGVSKKWTRSKTGVWIEEADKKAWWKFWK